MNVTRSRIIAGAIAGAGLALACGAATAHGIYKAHPFKELDSNRDGLISKDEYAAHSAKHTKKNPKTTPVAESHPFSELDPDNDGTISKKEYAAHSTKHAKSADHGHGAMK